MSEPAEFDPKAILTLRRLGSAAFTRQMIDLFHLLAEEKLAAARRALEAGDLEALADAVHPLKSSSGGIGAHVMFELAARLEYLSRRGERETLPQLLTELENAYTRVKPSLVTARETVAP